MRYCFKCGNEIGNERFCTKCGVDNGEVKIETTEKTEMTSSAGAQVQMPNVDAKLALHWAAIICFAIASITLLSECLEASENVCLSTMLLFGNIIPAIGYYVLAMWGILASVIFVLNGKDNTKNTAIGAAAVMIIIMIAFAILNSIFKNADGSLRFISIVYASFRYKLSSIIVFCVLSVASGIAGLRIKNKEA